MASIQEHIVEGLDKNASLVGNKFSKNNWNSIERKLSDFDLKIKDELCNLACSFFNIHNAEKAQENNIKAIGDDYLSIRQKLIEFNLISNVPIVQDKKVQNKKVIKKVDLIRQENTIRIILEDLKLFEQNFDYDDFRMPAALTSKLIEMRAIGFLQCAKFITINISKYTNNNIIKPKKISFIYSIIIAFIKFINSLNSAEFPSLGNASVNIKFSSHLLEDSKLVLERIKTLYNFDGMVAYNTSPQLLFFTDFDVAIPTKTFSPYPHQIEIITNLYNSLKTNSPLLITLRTMTGTGKTTTVVALAKLIELAKNIIPQHKNTILIFCCNLKSVMDQAAQWLFNATIPFAIGSIDSDKIVKIINNYNCKSDDKRVAIICNPEVCYDILINNTDNNYVLFLDEPTIGADVMSETAKMNVRVMSNLPKYTILSSATLPPNGYIWTHEISKYKYNNSNITDIYSNKIHIGCEIKTFNGELVVPHLNRTNKQDLINTIHNIKQLPFLGRAYTINIVKNMYTIMSKEKVKDLPNIPVMFKDINNLNTDTVRNLAMSMLELLANCDDETIKKVCHTKIEMNAIKLIEIEKKKDNEDSDIEWEEEISTIQDTTKVDMANLGTKSAHRYMRQNLIATTNPLDFVKNNFNNLLTDIKNDIISLKKLIIQHYQELNLWEKEFSKLQQREEAKLNRKETNRKDVGKLQRAKQVDELENAKPQLKFPYKYQINTQEHIKEYAKKTNIAIDKNAIRNSLNLDEVPYNELNVSDDLILLLLAGVGVYTGNLDSNYISTVMRLAEEGKLAYIVADSSIS